MKSNSLKADHGFRFVTNHAHILAFLGANPRRAFAMSPTRPITERTAATIVGNLRQAGYVTISRDGRRNRYVVHDNLPLRHPRHRHRTVGELIRFLEEPPSGGQARE